MHVGDEISDFISEALKMKTDMGVKFVASAIGMEEQEFRAFLLGKRDLTGDQARAFQEKFGDQRTRQLLEHYING